MTMDANTNTAELSGMLSREQHETGRRFRGDWHDGHERLPRQGASGTAFDRASAYLLGETDVYVHNRVVVVCIRDERPVAMAKRLGSAAGTPEHVALAGIIGQLKAGLDALGRHYAGEVARNTA